MQNNTRYAGAAIPESMEEAARKAAGWPDVPLSVLIRAGLELLATCDRDTGQRLVVGNVMPFGPKKKTTH